jgi:hypothetical protein
MNRFFRSVRRILIVPVTIAFVCAPYIPVAQAQSAPQLDKHARRIAKHLTKYRPGAYLDFEFRDSSESYGSLGRLAETSFEFTNADSNKVESHSYDELAHVKKAKEYIGAGSEGRHRVHLLLPVVISAAVVAAGIATYEALR